MDVGGWDKNSGAVSFQERPRETEGLQTGKKYVVALHAGALGGCDTHRYPKIFLLL